jgi:hypothetical protein
MKFADGLTNERTNEHELLSMFSFYARKSLSAEELCSANQEAHCMFIWTVAEAVSLITQFADQKGILHTSEYIRNLYQIYGVSQPSKPVTFTPHVGRGEGDEEKEREIK